MSALYTSLVLVVVLVAWREQLKTNRELIKALTALDDELGHQEGRLTMHAAQLKGAGERIRTIEAKQAADSMTIDDSLKRLAAVEQKPRAELSAVIESISRLRAELLGGTMPPNNMPVIGAVSELRTQVEGINSRLGNKVDRMVNLDKTLVSTVARDAARKEVRELKRAKSWLKRARNALFRTS